MAQVLGHRKGFRFTTCNSCENIIEFKVEELTHFYTEEEIRIGLTCPNCGKWITHITIPQDLITVAKDWIDRRNKDKL